MKETDLPEPLRRALAKMRDFPAPWCLAGGWALDLFLGRVTRDHADVELAIFRDDQAHLHRHLRGWAFEQVVDGRLVPWSPKVRLDLPVHEIHARRPDHRDFSIEFLLNERKADRWVYRRDPRVTRAITSTVLTSDVGCPILCPEIVLLYKSKSPRSKDEADFRAARGSLDTEQRTWLSRSLETVYGDHDWLRLL